MSDPTVSKRPRIGRPALYFNHHDLVDALSIHTSYVLSYVAQMTQMALDESLESLGIDARQLGVMVLIGETQHRSQAAVSEHMGLDPAHVARLVDDLKKRKYVSRDPDPGDRRYYNLTLTDEGKKILTTAKRKSHEIETTVFKSMNDAERKAFDAALRKIADHQFSRKQSPQKPASSPPQ